MDTIQDRSIWVGAEKGIQCTHIHIPAQSIATWKEYLAGEVDYYRFLRDVHALIFGLPELGVSIAALKWEAVAKFFGTRLGLVVIGILALTLAIFDIMISQYYESQLDFVRNTVETFLGDGFTWIWGKVNEYIDEVIAPPGASRGVWLVKHCEWYQSWGKDRDVVQFYSVTWYEKAGGQSDKYPD